jgi:leucyl-tRNA synthetase
MIKYDHSKIEKKWQKKWLEEKTYEPDLDNAKKPFFNLMMYPYPSAEGLHVGNMYAFTGSDIYGRYQRMRGNDVFEPIGLDGFGIHSENYAMKIGTHPADQAKISEKRFYEQLQKIGNGFAWNERLETYDPEYYRWTQWLFVQMWKHGLAYRKKQAVNWCPKDLTVLADEQVENGKCERCGSAVEKRDLEQWSFRITDYADRLLQNLDTLDWSEKVKIAQKNWIGKKEGIEITYPIDGTDETVSVFTTRPDTNFGATFIVVAPEHPLVARITLPGNKNEVDAYVKATAAKNDMERIAEGRKKTGAFTGRYAINHLTGKKMPIWVSDFVLANFGTGAVVGVPGHDLRDFEFAQTFNIEIIRVVIGKDGDKSPIINPEQVQEESGTVVNSEFLDGMDIHAATEAIMDYIEKKGWGKRVVQFRIRDWLVGRQRYWGPPIPMVFCEACAKAGRGESHSAGTASRDGHSEMPGWYAVPEDELPVKLPYVKDFRPTGSGVSPLAHDKKFYETKCPGCGGAARRETDVSDTFLDSAWYYLRYLSPEGNKAAFDAARAKKWLPVNIYIGGAEHSVLHLLYARFVAMALHDWGFLDFEEPFAKFRAHGLVIKDGAKMSKSKGNVVNPDEYVSNFGADTLRTYLMFMAPFEDGGGFSDQAIVGVARFLEWTWKYFTDERPKHWERNSEKDYAIILKILHFAIKKITKDIETLNYNTAISQLMIVKNVLQGYSIAANPKSKEYLEDKDAETFLKLLAPFAPHITEEIWRETLEHKTSIHREPWPEYDSSMIKEDTFTLVLQVNSKTRDMVPAAADISEADARALALANEKVKATLSGKEPKKIIYVPGRLVNIVV